MAILTYHVGPGELMAADIIEAGKATTAQGGTVEFSVNDGGAMIQNANIVQTDILQWRDPKRGTAMLPSPFFPRLPQWAR